MKLTLKLMIATVTAVLTQTASCEDTPIRVACVGDSITVGVGAGEDHRYTDQLGAILGDKYRVKRCGKSGATLLKKGDRPYWEQGAYQDALKFNPDIVVILLGTNDTKSQNWKHKADFKSDYIELVKSFLGLDSKPKVFICHPVPKYSGRGKGNGIIVKEMIPFIDEVAKETGATVIDLHTPLDGKPELIPDGVHPNKDGAKIMAETIAKAITATEK